MSFDMFSEVAGLEHVLNYHVERHGILSSNLANADTPGFVPKDIAFAEAMQTPSMQVTNGRHLEGQPATSFAARAMDVEPHTDGSGVEIEQAMAQVAANRLRYEEGIEFTRRRLGMLRYAATNGGNA